MEEKEKHIYDTIIIGGGPAGLTAAIYAARSSLDTLVITSNYGGQAARSPRIENIPGFESISGSEFMDKLYNQVEKLGVEKYYDTVDIVEKDRNVFVLKSESGDQYYSYTVIAATGAEHRKLGLSNETELVNAGALSYCVTCDGAFYKDKKVAVIGDGNAALQYAESLANYCRRVYICALTDKLFGEKTMIDRILNNKIIKVLYNMETKTIKLQNPNAENHNHQLSIYFNNEEDMPLLVDGAFVAIGQIPNNQYCGRLSLYDQSGYIATEADGVSTYTDGFFAAGDCTHKRLRQIVTAQSDGAVAAMKVLEYINRYIRK